MAVYESMIVNEDTFPDYSNGAVTFVKNVTGSMMTSYIKHSMVGMTEFSLKY